MKKIMLFLASDKGYETLKILLSSKYKKNIACAWTFVDNKILHNYSSDIELLCKNNSIDCFYWYKDWMEDVYDYIQTNKITSAIAISWKYLIPLSINNVLEDKLIIFHDSLLPKYRGFCPTPTAIINGENEHGVTVFFADEEVDTGEIILQKSFKIGANEYINEIIKKESVLYSDMMLELMEMITNNTIISYKQNSSEASYSIWRNNDDYQIDWSKSNYQIYNFIRALSFPYLGAFTTADNKKIIILESKCEDKELKFEIRDVGKIWKIENNEPLVICGKGLLRITHAIYDNGENVVFNSLRKRFK